MKDRMSHNFCAQNNIIMIPKIDDIMRKENTDQYPSWTQVYKSLKLLANSIQNV